MFRHRDYNIYFWPQLASVIGTWTQMFAILWLVAEITGRSKLWTGVAWALPMAVTMVFILIGGAISDTFNRKKLFILSQTLGMINAFCLVIVVWTGYASLLVVMSLIALSGLINALDMPLRQTIYTNIVPKEDVPAAAAMNTILTTVSIMLGPGLAGIVIDLIGTGWTFMINGLSFLPAIISLFFLSSFRQVQNGSSINVALIGEGIGYAWRNKKILVLLLIAPIAIAFGYCNRAILPNIGTEIFGGGAMTMGLLGSSTGLGTFIGSLFVSSKAKNELRFKKIIFCGMFLCGSVLTLFPIWPNLIFGCTMFLLSGVGMTLMITTSRAQLLASAKSDMFGRVISINMMLFMGSMMASSFAAGYFSEIFGIAAIFYASGSGLLLSLPILLLVL